MLPVIYFFQGTYNQRKLEQRWRRAAADRSVPKPGLMVKAHGGQRGFPLTRLEIPKIGLQSIIVEGTTSSALSQGPGHFPKTAMPGGLGNCCIAGHRNMYGCWFSKLDRLNCGDTILLRTPDKEFVYEVNGKFCVVPTDVSVLVPTPGATLTLITCTPVPRPTLRLIIVAGLIRQRELNAKSSSAVL